MKKEELKYGNVVETKKGKRYIKTVYDNLPCLTDAENLVFECIKEDLTTGCQTTKIMKVYEDYTCSKLLWERPQDLLTQEERDYLKAVIMPFKDKVESISRTINYFGKENIEIFFKIVDDSLLLPYIENMTLKFKGLEAKKKYTLEELGLEG